MNFALPALVLFILGFLFRSGLKRVEREVLDFSPFGRIVADAVLWAIFVHAAWLLLAWACFSRVLEPGTLLGLLSSVPPVQTAALSALGEQFGWVATYVASLLFSCQLIPVAIRRAISAWRLDRHDAPFGALFRFHHAPWYYLLTGADFKAGAVPDMVMVSAIVEVGKEPILYVGVLDDFFFAADGQLDRIVLQQVVRRPLSSDKPAEASHGGGEKEESETGRFYPIDGDYLVIRYSDAKTLNVQFIKLTSSPAPTGA